MKIVLTVTYNPCEKDVHRLLCASLGSVLDIRRQYIKPCMQSPILLVEITHPSLKIPNFLLEGFIVIVTTVIPVESSI